MAEATPEIDDTRYTLIEHLTELRSRLIKSLLAILATTSVALYFSPELLEYTMRPLASVLHDKLRVETVLVHADDKRGEELKARLETMDSVRLHGRLKDLSSVRALAEAQIKENHPLELIMVSTDVIKDEGALVSDLLEGLKPQPEVVYLLANVHDGAAQELQLEGAALIPDPPRSAALHRVVRRAAATAGKSQQNGQGGLVVLSPLDPFIAYVKIALVVGLFVACPVWLFQAWRFVAPGLYRNERMLVLPCILSASVLFVLGGLFAYYAMFPVMFDVLVNQMMPSSVVGAFTVDRYLSLLITMTLAFGVVFELPLALGLLAAIGLVTPAMLRSVRKYAIIANFIFAAVITPTTDPLSLFMMAIPLCLFYEAGIILAVFMSRKRQVQLAPATAEPPA